jgi:hypothetical protein
MDRTNVAHDIPEAKLVCDSSAISCDDRLRYYELRAHLYGALISWREIDGGYALRLNDEAISREEVSEWIKLEGLCCPWLSLETEPILQGTLGVRMTAPDQAKQVLRAEFTELFERTISQDEVSR